MNKKLIFATTLLCMIFVNMLNAGLKPQFIGRAIVMSSNEGYYGKVSLRKKKVMGPSVEIAVFTTNGDKKPATLLKKWSKLPLDIQYGSNSVTEVYCSIYDKKTNNRIIRNCNELVALKNVRHNIK